MEYTYSEKFKNLKPSAIREILKYSSMPGCISLSAGNPSPDAFPKAELAEISARILSENPNLAFQYGLTEGYTPLRDHLRGYMKKKHNIDRDFDDLIITTGAQQVMELAVKVLINEGEGVICEDPSFIGSLNSFRSLGARLIGVPVLADGMDMAALEKALDDNKDARFIYTIPNFQNPTGVTMSLEKRHKLYELAKAYGVLIVEDNPYGDLRYSGENIPAIKSFDEDGIVIYAGSFSKVISPGLRVGYAIAPEEVLKKMIVAKQVEDVHTAILPQMLCHEFMTKYDFEAHLERLRSLYREKAALCCSLIDSRLAPLGVTHFAVNGGLFAWCMLPAGVDMPAFCLKAVSEHKVAVVPGTAFLPYADEPCSAFRVNFSTPSAEQLEKGMDILASVLKELL